MIEKLDVSHGITEVNLQMVNPSMRIFSTLLQNNEGKPEVGRIGHEQHLNYCFYAELLHL